MLNKAIDSFIINETDKGKELTFQIKQLMKRDNEIMLLRQDNENLRLKLVDLERTIAKLRNRN